MLAVERYLRAEIQNKADVNIAVQSFEQRLAEAMRKYNNHTISILEVLNELITMAKRFHGTFRTWREVGAYRLRKLLFIMRWRAMKVRCVNWAMKP